MNRNSSVNAVLEAIRDACGRGNSYNDNAVVTVSAQGEHYIYNGVHISIYEDFGYSQMCVDVVWEDDPSQPGYTELGLHGKYNTNFQQFTNRNGTLTWKDGKYTISARLR